MSTRVGYTGGKTENPTYGTVCGGDGHTEALKVEFDPRVISYDDPVSYTHLTLPTIYSV